MNSKNSETREAAACCADSELTLKEQISKLDDMVLNDGNESNSNKIEDGGLLA